MTTEQFVYWLNGYLEISKTTQMGPDEIAEVRKHLALVLTKKTAPASTGTLTWPGNTLTIPAFPDNTLYCSTANSGTSSTALTTDTKASIPVLPKGIKPETLVCATDTKGKF
jgi:hypothetical protein